MVIPIGALDGPHPREGGGGDRRSSKRKSPSPKIEPGGAQFRPKTAQWGAFVFLWRPKPRRNSCDGARRMGPTGKHRGGGGATEIWLRGRVTAKGTPRGHGSFQEKKPGFRIFPTTGRAPRFNGDGRPPRNEEIREGLVAARPDCSFRSTGGGGLPDRGFPLTTPGGLEEGNSAIGATKKRSTRGDETDDRGAWGGGAPNPPEFCPNGSE